jgi:hypothetical protein
MSTQGSNRVQRHEIVVKDDKIQTLHLPAVHKLVPGVG